MTKQPKNQKITRPLTPVRLATEKDVQGLTDLEPGNIRARAQGLALNALSARSTTERLDQALKAVVLDPRCTDALVILADVFDDIDEYVEAMDLIVMRAAEDLGPELFERERGHFWELVETRPYMRARLHLALALDEGEMTDEAITEFEGILDLDPNDNMGARFGLLGLYFEAGRLDMASSLLTRYADDASAQFAWMRVLLRILQGDTAAAEAELQKARETNKHVEGYLADRKGLPEKLPGTYAVGDVNEAAVCAFEIQDAWEAHPDAVRWLKERGVSREKKGKH
ncbi:hypothetical protein EHM92_00395 [bacterium]|nr:MAG: hypothetical protein EHM92_00395 [bacterium]